MPSFTIQPMDEASARAIIRWHYDAPYDLYNVPPDEADASTSYWTDPQNGCYRITNEFGELVGYCSFGLDGQVPGGDYRQEALDIGMGVRPDLTGQGQGVHFAQAVLDFAAHAFAHPQFRVTIAAFNKRAQRVWQKLKFHPIQQFTRERDGLSFIVFVREKG